MQYGYFDDQNKEYVITRPDTPGAWSNYLGSLKYGAIITNNAGGYSFIESGANGRLIRFRFNAVPTNQAGRFIYLRDQESGDYWSASWQPVGKDPDKYKSVCRHGTAYTIISSAYEGIETETAYYVPLNQVYEVWALKVKNTGNRSRKLALFSFVELTNNNNETQDLVNLQYTTFISRTYYRKNLLLQTINENLFGSDPDNGPSDGKSANGVIRFFGLVGAAATGYDGSRESFIGDYHTYANPVAVEKGRCSNSLNYTGNSCGSLQSEIELAPGEEKELIYILGPGNEKTAREIMGKYEKPGAVNTELDEVKRFWHSKLEHFKVNTPDASFNSMVNVWNAYQCFITFFWSRAASLIYCGLRNGLGFRDTVQDIQGIMHLDQESAIERLRLMLSGQVASGGALPLIRYNHTPGKEIAPDDPRYAEKDDYPKFRCDDTFWLFNTVPQYMKETGNWNFIDEVIPFADKGEGTVYEHLKRALQFSLARLGVHGLVMGLEADWNDCLRLEEEGETIFASMQLYQALAVFKEFAERKGNKPDSDWAEAELKKLSDNLQKHTWEGDQFVRGFVGSGQVIGSKKNDEAQFWLNPQVWSVLSGAASEDQGRAAMDKVYRELATDHGAMLFYSAFRKFGLPIARMILFLPGTKENAGIFSQAQGWLVRAETMLGNGNRAFEYYQKANPACMNDKAEIRETEPYVHCQFTEGKDSPFHGRAHVHWLTGTASTVQVAAIEGILGVQPDYDGLRIDPCIPDKWSEFDMERVFRGKNVKIKVQNPKGVQKGVGKIVLNGEEINDNLIPIAKMKDQNEVTVIMG